MKVNETVYLQKDFIFLEYNSYLGCMGINRKFTNLYVSCSA